jgi:hypothetical protein
LHSVGLCNSLYGWQVDADFASVAGAAANFNMTAKLLDDSMGSHEILGPFLHADFR